MQKYTVKTFHQTPNQYTHHYISIELKLIDGGQGSFQILQITQFMYGPDIDLIYKMNIHKNAVKMVYTVFAIFELL